MSLNFAAADDANTRRIERATSRRRKGMGITVATSVVRRPRHAPYIALSGLMALMAVVGFWPGYFGPLALGTLVQPLLIHIHAIIFTGWLVLFFLQAYFAATRRIQLHLAVGRVGICYGVLLLIVGLTTGVVRAAARTDGFAEELLLAIFEDMLMFGGFFGVAIWYRKRPAIHRPAMVVAATSLLVAAVARMEFLPSETIRFLIWSLPVLIALAVQFRQTRTVHPVYLVGLGIFAIRAVNIPFIAISAAWESFSQWMFRTVV